MIQILARIKLFPFLCIIITSYFVYHGLYGARGYHRMAQVQTEIDLARKIAEEKHSKRIILETKVKSLSPDSLDMDQLEESALRILNMGNVKDIIILSGSRTSGE